MPYPTTDEMMELAIKVIIAIAIVLTLIGLVPFGCSVTETGEPSYDYAGPDGTLTGVPWELDNYVVEDHDTGVYYFLIRNRDTGDVAICPRYESDGTFWINPLHKEEE